jgi:Fur family transcriptional regulator, ferric uptake regulator
MAQRQIYNVPLSAKNREHLLGLLRDQGLRLTDQRLAIIEAAFETKEHYTAEQLLTAARLRDAHVSRATVYRTLPLLVETGFLHELDLGRDQTVYDPNYTEHPTHNHLICLDCDKIFEFEDEMLEAQENAVTRKLGFSPASKHIRIEANCDKLKKAGNCKNVVG